MAKTDRSAELAKEWGLMESKLASVVKEMMARDMQKKPFSEGKLIPRNDYIDLYERVYHLSVCDVAKDVYGRKLYKKYKHIVQRNIQTVFYAQEKSSENDSKSGPAGKIVMIDKGEEGLESFVEKFKTFKEKMLVLSHVFAYMERYYVPRNALPTLKEVLRTELNEQVLDKARGQLKNELENLMDKRRDGKSVKEDLFGDVVVTLFLEMSPKPTKNNMDVLVDLETKVTEGKVEKMDALNDLETFLLQRTRAYYEKTAPQWPQESLEKKAKQALSYERDFAAMFLPEKSVSEFEERLVKIFEEILLAIASKNADNMEDNKLGGSLEGSVKASLACSTHHKLQDSSKSSIADAFRTANV
ncbi:hypothetical protein GOP47_0016780 [Adiantum capillus-veneris]|uniref:Cullin N-terminal domain-containing protein n=1 Tax=Adiantum capillus-veneris TaxID=13818 RepID=A0A9D4UID5_ADICA|nr:hypothetical protein GOP47_0016780 [Adiantum capillus-veneris]